MLVLEVNLRARRELDGQDLLLDRLQNGATLRDGDRLQLLVTTADDAHVYVAFCSTNDASGQLGELSLFPPRGSIRAKAGQVTFVPGPQKEIVLDDTPGEEVLYLIVSRVELSLADASLASAIDAARSARAADCQELRHAAREKGPSTSATRRPASASARKKRSDEKPGRLGGRAAVDATYAGTSYAGITGPRASQVRGAYVEDRSSGRDLIRADAAGIVVLRYRFTHQSVR